MFPLNPEVTEFAKQALSHGRHGPGKMALQMNDLSDLDIPETAATIYAESKALDFRMISEPLTGALLRTLAASKPGARFLELGTGTGAATAWLLDGMDDSSTLVTVDNDQHLTSVAQRHLGRDPRVTFVTADAGLFLRETQGRAFDFIFADTWAGKYEDLNLALDLLTAGSLYVIDDMLPQVSWPPGHEDKVPRLLSRLAADPRLRIVKLSWASGIVVAVCVADRRDAR